jgi:hypothetical protein
MNVPLALPVLCEIDQEGVLHWLSQWHTMKSFLVVAERQKFWK